MSVSSYTYVGPYIICNNPRITVEKTLDCCNNIKCRRKGKKSISAYCPDCGAKISSSTVFEMGRRVDSYKLEESIYEAIFLANQSDIGSDTWLPNRSWNCKRKCHLIDLVGSTSLDDTMIVDEKAMFTIFFEDAIKYLKTVYDEDSVVVLWGIVVYVI